MKKAKINFIKCIQDSQEFGSNDEYMISRVFFNLVFDDGEATPILYSQIKQTAGSAFNEEQIEVGLPVGIKGPFNFDAFSKYAKDYFLGLVGSRGSGIRINGNCSNVRMMNNTFVKNYVAEIEISDPGVSW